MLLPPLERLRAAWTALRAKDDARRAHHLQVVITDRCNLACSGCARSNPAHRPTNREMPRERFEELLARFRPRVVTLLGEGDPLLHRNLVGLVEACRARHARPILATNLTVGDDATFGALADAGLAGAKVTLSSSNRDGYRALKGRDLFDDALVRMASLRARRVPLMVELWLDKASVGEARRHVVFASEHKLERVSLLWSDPHEDREAPDLTAEQAAELTEAAHLAATLGVRTNLAALRRAHAPKPTPVRGRCALPWLRAYVDLNGNTAPCVDLAVKGRSEPDGPHTNAFAEPAPFTGAAFRHAREAFRRGEEPHPVCAGCARCRLPGLALTASRPRAARGSRPASVTTG